MGNHVGYTHRSHSLFTIFGNRFGRPSTLQASTLCRKHQRSPRLKTWLQSWLCRSAICGLDFWIVYAIAGFDIFWSIPKISELSPEKQSDSEIALNIFLWTASLVCADWIATLPWHLPRSTTIPKRVPRKWNVVLWWLDEMHKLIPVGSEKNSIGGFMFCLVCYHFARLKTC